MASARIRMILRAWCLALLGTAAAATQAQTITVAAAASAADAVRELAPLFEATYPGQRVQVTTGASGALIQQAGRGAPIDVLITADPVSMDQAEAKGLLAPGARRPMATNTLVLIQPAAATPLGSLEDLAGPRVGRIGMGQPDTVPAGRLAQQALEDAKVWPKVKPRVVNALSVRQVLDYVSRGEVDAGFVYATDAQKAGAAKVRIAFKVTAAPVVVTVAPMVASLRQDIASRFVEFVQTPRAQAVLKRHGFGAP